MPIVYGISIILLFVAIMLIKKSEQKLNVIVWSVLTSLVMLCYNTFICYIFTMCNIPITLVSLTITNLIITIALFIIMLYLKQIQSYEVDKKDIGAIAIIFAVVFLVVIIQYGIPFNIKYIMTDSSAHYLSAYEFYQRDTLLLKAENIHVDKCLMPGAYSNIGNLFRIFAPLIGEMNLYHIFILFDIYIFTLGGILLYFIIKKHIHSNLTYGLAIVVSILYMLGYQLNTMLSGYSYLSVGIIIIETIILFMQFFEKDELKTSVNIVFLCLLCTQVFLSYYLFVPAVYGALGIYYLIHLKKKHGKIWNKEMIAYVLITLVIPTIIGFTYQILPEMTSLTQIQTLENIKTEGYIYRNMITNVLLLIPFSVYFLYHIIKNRKMSFMLVFFIIFILYMILIGVAMKMQMISTYYFYKLHFILWVIMWILCYKGAITIIENSKIGDIIVKTFMIFYVGLVIASFLTSQVQITKTTTTSESLKDVMDIYGINKTLMIRLSSDFSTEEIEILKYIKENNISLHDKNTLILANQRQEYWIWGILQYQFKDNLNYATTNKDIKNWNENYYEYVIYFYRAGYYKEYRDSMNFENCEVLFENESGAILKNNLKK